jgi:HEAT repeat protein
MPLFGPPNIAALEAKRDTQGLIKALSYKDAVIRIAAADALAPIRDPLAVEPLVALLKDDNAGVRRAAVGALSARGGFRVVEPLVAALADKDPDVRVTASTAVYRRLMTDPDQDARRATAVALGKIRDPNAVEPLVKSIMDADEGVRLAAIRALQSIGDVKAVMPLVVVQAQEQVRGRSSGRSSLAVERAASGALDALCGPAAIEVLEAGLGHEDVDVRENVVRRLSRIGVPAVSKPLESVLSDPDPVIRRSAARGLSDIGWKPTNDEKGAQYWAALREWRRCAECGPAAIPILIEAHHGADGPARTEIVAGLVGLGWEPETPDALAAGIWAARGEWDKVVAVGQPAIETLNSALKDAPHWRDRVTAAKALVSLDQQPDAPFENLELVTQALGLFDSPAENDSAEADKKTALADFAAEHGLVNHEAGETLELCACGYPISRVNSEGERSPLVELLGRQTEGATTQYFCPACDTLRPD